MKELVLLGGGGHCRACIDVIEQQGEFRIAGIVDLPEHCGQSVLGYPIFASDGDLPGLLQQYRYFLVTVGQIKSCTPRKRLFDAIRAGGGELPVIVSPLAHVSPHASVGQGTIIMHHALVNTCASVGENCIINTKALVEHDAVVGNHCHISTGAILNGGVRVEDECFVGSGVVAREGVRIGQGTVIGCGGKVLHEIGQGYTVR